MHGLSLLTTGGALFASEDDSTSETETKPVFAKRKAPNFAPARVTPASPPATPIQPPSLAPAVATSLLKRKAVDQGPVEFNERELMNKLRPSALAQRFSEGPESFVAKLSVFKAIDYNLVPILKPVQTKRGGQQPFKFTLLRPTRAYDHM